MAIGVGGWIRAFGAKCSPNLLQKQAESCGRLTLPAAKCTSMAMVVGHKALRLNVLEKVVAGLIPRFTHWLMERGELFMCFSAQVIAMILSSESIFVMRPQTASQSLRTRHMTRMISEHFSKTSVLNAAFRQKPIGSTLLPTTNRNTRNAIELRMPFSASRNSGQPQRDTKNLLQHFLAS